MNSEPQLADWKFNREKLLRFENDWPFPLARACVTLRVSTSWQEAALASYQLLEVTLRHLLYLSLSELRHLTDQATFEKRLRDAYVPRLTLGSMTRALREILPLLKRDQEQLFEPAWVDFYFAADVDTELLGDLINYRNDNTHGRSEQAADAALQEFLTFKQKLDSLLDGLEFLTDSRLLWVSGATLDAGQNALSANVLTGSHEKFEVHSFPIDQPPYAHQVGLYRPADKTFLSLRPFYLAIAVDKNHLKLSFLDQMKGQKLLWNTPPDSGLVEREQALFWNRSNVPESLPFVKARVQRAVTQPLGTAEPSQVPFLAKPRRAGLGTAPMEKRGPDQLLNTRRLWWWESWLLGRQRWLSAGLVLLTLSGMLTLGIWLARSGKFAEPITGNDPTELIKKGYIAFEQKDYNKALAYYNRCLELDPDYAAAFNNRALVLQALEKWPQALEDSNRAIALDPDYATAYSTRGWTFHRQGQSLRGLQDLDKAIELKPDSRWPWFYRAEIHTAQGDCAKAETDYQFACKLGHAGACKARCP